MLNIAAMSTIQLALLAVELRDNIENAKAAENLVLVQDLRRALAKVTAELRDRKPAKSYEVFHPRATTPLASRTR